MALTKLMHMKQCGSGNPSRHLKNGIAYIMREEKTQTGRFIGGNAGSTPAEVYRTMMNTKRDYGKLHGRQGYHFVISFKEEVPPEKVYEIMQQFCQEYLGDHYDYVFSVHTDSTHVHAHVVFNSVSRTTGLKYHYQKGDWEKDIQPVTDRICMQHGFEKFEYEGGESKDYGEWKREQEGKRTWIQIVQEDIDRLLKEVTSVDGLCKALVLAGYRVRRGNSRKYGGYLALLPAGGKKAVRSYQIGKAYGIEGLEKRIRDKENPLQVDQAARVPKVKSSAFPRTRGESPDRPNMFYPSAYQYYYIRRYCQNTLLYEYQNARNYHDIRETEELARCSRYLIRNNLRSEKQLQERQEQLEARQASLDAERTRLYRTVLNDEESSVLQTYQKLCEQRDQTKMHGMEEEWEAADDAVRTFEEHYPVGQLQQREEERRSRLKELRKENAALRNEKKTLEQISRQKRNKEAAEDWKYTAKKRL